MSQEIDNVLITRTLLDSPKKATIIPRLVASPAVLASHSSAALSPGCSTSALAPALASCYCTLRADVMTWME